MADFRSRSRSRSQRGEGTQEDRGTWRRWSADFDEWAQKHLDDSVTSSSEQMMASYKRALRLKARYSGKLIEDPTCLDTLAIEENDIQSWARVSAKKDYKKDVSKTKRKEKKQKSNKDKEHKNKKPDNNDEEHKSSKPVGKDEQHEIKKQGSGEPFDVPECRDLAIPSAACPLQEVLDSLRKEAAAAQQKVENIEQKVDEYIARQKTLATDIPTSAKKLKELEKMAVSIPRIKSLVVEHKINHADLIKDKDKVGVGLELAKSKLREARANAAKLEKQVVTVSSQIARDEARLQDADMFEEKEEDSNGEKPENIKLIFDTMDRSGSGKVNKRDFIKALEQDVALFFGLPSKILQEDGSRCKMEAVFQKISMDGCEFDISEFEAFYGDK